jgi:membrane peptidoglycan carboxypeptidase
MQQSYLFFAILLQLRVYSNMLTMRTYPFTLTNFRNALFVILLSAMTVLAFIPIFTYLYFAKDLHTRESIMNRNDTGLLLTDRHGTPFFSFYEARDKTNIPLHKIPVHVQQAVISAEDKEFYHHPGFSLRGIIRSLYLDIVKKDVAFGGSTITQQLVKNSLLHPQKSFLRKYQEIVLAQEIERKFSKEDILEMYLNSAYFGEGSFGIEEAALAYFGKHAESLTLSEAAMLAGILPSPSRMSPISGDKEEAFERQHLVLDAMVSLHYLSQEEAERATKLQLVFHPIRDRLNARAPHFALMVRQELVDAFGEERVSRSGFTVRTTLDLAWQTFAEQTVKTQVAKLAGQNVSNGAAVVIDPKNGEIRAFVGSVDWYNKDFGKVNIPTSLRPPGSAFKPIIYAAAMEKKIITPATVLHDRPTKFAGNYKPEDYDKKTRGNVLVRRALANSLNIPAVEIMTKLGVENALAKAKAFGITTLQDPSQYGLSLVLGAGEVKLLELTNAYGAFANKGVGYDPVSVRNS